MKVGTAPSPTCEFVVQPEMKLHDFSPNPHQYARFRQRQRRRSTVGVGIMVETRRIELRVNGQVFCLCNQSRSAIEVVRWLGVCTTWMYHQGHRYVSADRVACAMVFSRRMHDWACY